MVRVWHPELIPVLDDNRLLAGHAETHYIDGALTRKGGMWWQHPETQRMRPIHEVLRSMHYELASEMLLRGYNHKSPMGGLHLFDTDLEVAIYGTEQLDCFFHRYDWLKQDKADLYRKWSREARWDFKEYLFNPGSLIRGHPGMFHPPRRPQIITPDYFEYRQIAEAHPHREWTKADSKRLKAQMQRMGLLPAPP